MNDTSTREAGQIFTRKILFCRYIIVLALSLALADSAFALNYNTPPILTTLWTHPHVGAPVPFSFVGTTRTGYDTIRFNDFTHITLNVRPGQRVGRLPYLMWQNVEFGDDALTTNMTVSIVGGSSTYGADLSTGYTRTLELGMLNLNHVDATIESGVTLKFAASTNGINLKSSSMTFGSSGATAVSYAPLTITSISGDNEFIHWAGVIDTQSTQINVSPGSSLKFTDSGDRSPPYFSDRLYFRYDVVGLVDNATMEFNSSNVYFNSSQFQFTNNSSLNITGYFGSRAQFKYLSVTNSQINQELNTRLQVDRTLTLQGVAITMDSGATIDANMLSVTGDSTITGAPYGRNQPTNSIVTPSTLNVTASQTLTQDGAYLVAGEVWLEADAVVNVTNSGRASFYRLWCYGDNVINVSTNSTLAIVPQGGQFGGFANDRILRDVTFNIDASSILHIHAQSHLEATDNVSTQTIFNNAGQIWVHGVLGGQGTINGTGSIEMFQGSALAPGYNYSGGGIHTMAFENSLDFVPGSTYQVDLGISGGAPINDKIEYIDQNMNIADISSIEVNVTGSPGATALHGKSFTIIASRDAASTGTIVRGSSDPTILEGATVPALIDFTITDDNTNGHTDVTLNAAKQGATLLLTHPSVTTPNTAQTASLLVHAANTGNTAVQTHLNTLQNSQVTSHFNSVHAEPYSSYMTVSLEQIDLVRDSVMSRGSSPETFSPGKSHINRDVEGGKRTWVNVLYVDGDVDGDQHLGGFDYKLTSAIVGQDLVSLNNATFGAYFSGGTQRMDEHDIANQNLKGTVYHLGMYSHTDTAKGWSIRSIAGYSYGDHESTRRVSLGSHSSSVDADYDSHAVYVGIEAGVPWIDKPSFKLAPEVGGGYSYYTQSAFKESGDPALGLRVDKASAQSITTYVGLNAQGAPIFGTSNIRPQAFVRYEHDWFANANDKHSIDAALISNPNHKQKFVGRNRGAHAGMIGLGVVSDISSALQISGGVVYSVTTHGNELGFGLNLTFKW